VAVTVLALALAAAPVWASDEAREFGQVNIKDELWNEGNLHLQVLHQTQSCDQSYTPESPERAVTERRQSPTIALCSIPAGNWLPKLCGHR